MENGREFTKVVDEYKNRHELGRELSRGGQGIVYRTGDPDVIIKIDLRNESTAGVQKSCLSDGVRRYQDIRLLPIPSDFPIAKPMAVLENYPGYVMEFLNGMEPILRFIDVGKTISRSFMPKWIENLPDERLRTLFCHYIDTGGLIRRMAVLARCAELLAMLHLRGIIYGDISPNNLFMSGMDTKQRNVWLIDADNLCLASQASDRGVYTPSYAAPEVVLRQSGNTFYTDQYAFAMMAFQVLAMKSPFQGALLESQEDEWDCDGVCAAERAVRGELPWIEDEDDESNSDAPEGRVLRGALISSGLRQLFQQTFGQLGRTLPTHRPSMLRWAVELYKASDCLVHCGHCGMDYYGGDAPETECPYCEGSQTSPYTFLRVSQEEKIEWMYRIFDRDGGEIPSRFFRSFILDDFGERFLRIYLSPDKKKIIIEKSVYASEKLFWSEEQSEDSFKRMSSTLRLPVGRTDSTLFFKLEGASAVIKCIIKGGDLA